MRGTAEYDTHLSPHAMPHSLITPSMNVLHYSADAKETQASRYCKSVMTFWYTETAPNLVKISSTAQPPKHSLLHLSVRGGADKSLARPTSWCRRTESIVSLERGVCSCAELQVFSCYRGWKEACQVTRAISTTSRPQLSSIFFTARQGAEWNSRHSDRNIRGTCTIVCHRQKLGGPV